MWFEVWSCVITVGLFVVDLREMEEVILTVNSFAQAKLLDMSSSGSQSGVDEGAVAAAGAPSALKLRQFGPDGMITLGPWLYSRHFDHPPSSLSVFDPLQQHSRKTRRTTLPFERCPRLLRLTSAESSVRPAGHASKERSDATLLVIKRPALHAVKAVPSVCELIGCNSQSRRLRLTTSLPS